MITADFHTHSNYSTDAVSTIEEMAAGAIQKGIDKLCLTEHMDYNHAYHTSISFREEYADKDEDFLINSFICDVPAYKDELYKCKERFDKNLTLLFGLELGLKPGISDYYKKLIASYPFDFLIGSSHEENGCDPYYPDYLTGRTPVEAYHAYFQNEIICAKECIDCFDVYGHIDYALRYHAPRDFIFNYSDFSDELDVLLKLLIENGRGIECNTGGYKYFTDEPNPRAAILKRYHELGGEILTVGSDAHSHTDIARNFSEAEDLLIACGFKYITTFKERKPLFVKL